MNWDFVSYVLAGMWNGLVYQVWIYFCIIGTIASVIGVINNLTKDRNDDEI